MSERILKALMQLFAIIAKVDEQGEEEFVTEGEGRRVVTAFLNQELDATQVDSYLKLFDEFLTKHQGAASKKDGKRKRTSVNSVKVLRICTNINEELTHRQKIIVLVRILEFIYANDIITDQELEFATTVADVFNVSPEEYELIKQFVSPNLLDDEQYLIINSEADNSLKNSKHIFSEGLAGYIEVINVKSSNIYFIRYTGDDELQLNGQPLRQKRVYVLNNGSSIRSTKVQPIYYSDILGRFLSDTTKEKVVFDVENVQYHFKGGKIGLHDFNIREESGTLIGIMGGSGAGKSTLLNVLNGNYKPSVGSIKINGIDVHSGDKEIEGAIGYVSQDDLLIEELTVFQNLYFNAKLTFGNLSEQQIIKKCLITLQQLGLSETKDLKVGSPLEKTISGGQRKRLNIALELIREPAVLFVDEPTSGLSSRDSENIMDLLKELALKGKLIFVVIHQPSSDIFKMFDKLMILDLGGYPIYNGNPVDAVVYFKEQINHVNQSPQCNSCGNVNPEQIFNIIEAKVVDEYGNLTLKRKRSPKEWNRRYLENFKQAFSKDGSVGAIPKAIFKIPSAFRQFGVFFKRDILSKLTNTQYLLINSLEAPLLAGILAFFVKFYDYKRDGEYSFMNSENMPQFLFISVVVALFIGLTVSAEEIIKDQKILKREEFLNLSRGSYLWSKLSIMFIISAVQTLTYVVVGNLILEIQGMWWQFWVILFSISCFANVLGLNISSTFNSAKVIYILIPILIIPQLLFSGVIVKYDKLYPLFSSQEEVPAIGNVMASRWAYEALAVTQYSQNDFEAPFFDLNRELSSAKWKKAYWVEKMENQGANMASDNLTLEERESALEIVKNEVERQTSLTPKYTLDVSEWSIESMNDDANKKAFESYLDMVRSYYSKLYRAADKEKNSLLSSMLKDSVAKAEFLDIKRSNFNKSLEIFLTNATELENVGIENGYLVQKSDPIYKTPVREGFFAAHFYSPVKVIFGKEYSTFWINNLVIWLMSILLIVALYFDFLRKVLESFGKLSASMFKKKER